MLIDWFTVGAQTLNFVILVWLLKRFLYRPILDAVDAREKRIAEELADAQRQKAAARREREEFELKNAQFDKQRSDILKLATAEAQSERQRMLDEARQAADALTIKRQEALRRDFGSLNQALRRRIQQEVFAVARKALADLSGASLEERIGERFALGLRRLDTNAKETLAAALRATSDPAVLRCALELPAEQKARIKQTLDDVFAQDVAVRFETNPDLVGGIEFSCQGQKLAWSIAEYLTALENSVSTLLDGQASPMPQSEAKAT